ncbi:hypothetical protein PR202_ga13102 [Eleusine coracana subsp. coracana]|uniref:Bifunctional inhibitor/plant lipid transfer protein/seed storage helical domain-containing protein n=1 Tax=Eleusine coracana subsp. coracana TaxID=191504 RepID=A0AAV5CD59_ELECO|nr:hypothetical protein PR202_ga13102 [Eleusine coracana subsp. coracana]
MAARARACLLAAAAVSLLIAAASAQFGSGDSDCTSALVSLSPCMDYISGNGTAAPSSSCCSQLRTVVQSKPQCLCSALGSGASSSPSAASQSTGSARSAFPKACNVQTPPVSDCSKGSGGSGGGSKATPSLPSGGAKLGSSAGLVLGLTVVAVSAVFAA